MLTAQQLLGGTFGGCRVIHWRAVEVANRNAAKAGRKRWNAADNAAYLDEYYRLIEILEGPDHPAIVQFKGARAT